MKGADQEDRFVNEQVWWPLRWTEAAHRFAQEKFGVTFFQMSRNKYAELTRVAHIHEAFGAQDPFHQMLDTYFDELLANRNLSMFAHIALDFWVRSCLRARKECMEYVSSHPEVLEQKIEKPLVITGMHRTGTTLLYNLLHQDERTRSTFMYEIYGDWDHMPSASSRAAHDEDPRMGRLKQLVVTAEKLFPEGTTKRNNAHPATHDMIEEDYLITTHQMNWFTHATLTGKNFQGLVFDPNKDFVFKYLKIYLQMLQTGYAPASHWTLKAPSHLLHIDSFMKSFPDARMVILHRDPKTTVGSLCYLIESIHGSYWHPNTWEKQAIGVFAVELYQAMLQRMMRYRDNHPDKADQFLDIAYSDLETKPMAQVQAIYENFGISFEDSLAVKMQNYLRENKKHKHGKPDYSLAAYGVSPQMIETQFAEYIERYLRPR